MRASDSHFGLNLRELQRSSLAAVSEKLRVAFRPPVELVPLIFESHHLSECGVSFVGARRIVLPQSS